jgi:hypothetical protein
MPDRVNVYAPYAYQVDIAKRTDLGQAGGIPEAGELTDVTMRLSETKIGPAIAPAVDNLPAAETGLVTEKGRRFAYVMDADLMIDYLLPLGHGARYYMITTWNGVDNVAVPFIVSKGSVH